MCVVVLRCIDFAVKHLRLFPLSASQQLHLSKNFVSSHDGGKVLVSHDPLRALLAHTSIACSLHVASDGWRCFEPMLYIAISGFKDPFGMMGAPAASPARKHRGYPDAGPSNDTIWGRGST